PLTGPAQLPGGGALTVVGGLLLPGPPFARLLRHDCLLTSARHRTGVVASPAGRRGWIPNTCAVTEGDRGDGRCAQGRDAGQRVECRRVRGRRGRGRGRAGPPGVEEDGAPGRRRVRGGRRPARGERGRRGPGGRPDRGDRVTLPPA